MDIMTFFHSEILDPLLNLAIEKWLMKREDLKETEVLFFYRNAPSVIIGRFQNPWMECDLKQMAEKGISLIRRESGGGAVYHDTGNLNFSFICGKERMVKEEKTALVTGALKSLGIEAEAGARNDIYIEGKKISGSAGRYTSSIALHHGTLLIDSDLEALNSYLTVNQCVSAQLKSQGIPSNRSKVTNIRDHRREIDYQMICRAIEDCAADSSGETGKAISISLSDVECIEEIETYRSDLAGWDWLYGKTPSFSIRCPVRIAGTRVACRFNVRKGLVETLFPEGRTADSREESLLAEKFLGRRFNEIFHNQSEISGF